MGKQKVMARTFSKNGACVSYDTLLVNVKTPPKKPTIAFTGSQLISTLSESGHYNWYFNEELITSGTQQSVLVNQLGNYQVEVFGLNGCGALSDNAIFNVTEEEPGDTPLTVYPNPVDNKINFQITNSTIGEFKLLVYSILNTVVKQLTIQKNDILLQQDLDLANLSSGFYILTLTSGHEFYTIKFIKR
jgi:hypothetical protein